MTRRQGRCYATGGPSCLVDGGADCRRAVPRTASKKGVVLLSRHAAFVVAMLSRYMALLWRTGMPDLGAARIRAFMRQIGVNAYNALTTRLFYPVRVFGWVLWKRPNSRPN